jgi:hypothetical protein
VAYLVLVVGAGYRMLRRAPVVWLSRRRDRLGEGVFWRFVLPGVAILILVVSGLGLILGQPSALYWLVAEIIGLLGSAARSSWDLLVKIGEGRRPPKPVG